MRFINAPCILISQSRLEQHRKTREGEGRIGQCRNKMFESQLTSNILSPIPGNNGPFDCARLVLVLLVREGCCILLSLSLSPSLPFPFPSSVRFRAFRGSIAAQLARVFRGMSSGKVLTLTLRLNISLGSYKLTRKR